VHGGYIEALTRDWKEINDSRLSAKDSNEKKSMNTHLHVLEAFANLYLAWPDKTLQAHIRALIHIFCDHIIDPQTNHLILFFDEQWNPKSDTISYGHDIEAAWLVQEAAEIIQDPELVQIVKAKLLQVVAAAERGLDSDGGLWYERETGKNHLVAEKHWWPQAEAMVGFYNAYQITNEKGFLQKSFDSWKFIEKFMLNKNDGEWFWGVKADYSIMEGEDKVGLWKCPYHNGRACIELIKRIPDTV
jgi:mannobiose 2-epimerase